MIKHVITQADIDNNPGEELKIGEVIGIPEAVKAKFQCIAVTDFGGQKQAQLQAVYSGSGENEDFAKATPYGELKINIDMDVPASNFFKPGKSYYLTFDEAE